MLSDSVQGLVKLAELNKCIGDCGPISAKKMQFKQVQLRMHFNSLEDIHGYYYLNEGHVALTTPSGHCNFSLLFTIIFHCFISFPYIYLRYVVHPLQKK